MILTIKDLQQKTYEVLKMANRENEAIKIKTNGKYVAIINDETINKIKKTMKIKGLEWYTT